MLRRKLVVCTTAAAITVGVAAPVLAAGIVSVDFGTTIEKRLESESDKLFGIKQPLGASAPETSGQLRTPAQSAADQVWLAKGLTASYLTRNAANQTDMMVFWPNDTAPTHLFTAVEVFAPATTSDGKPQPFVQRINLASGMVDVVLRGGLGGDPIRRTPWGTLIVGEETTDGALYEIIDPVDVTESTITNRPAGTVAKSDGAPETRVAKRSAVGIKSWEGIGLLPSGVIYSGDELRPGDAGADKDGGAPVQIAP